MPSLEDAICRAKGTLHAIADDLRPETVEAHLLSLIATTKELHELAPKVESAPIPAPTIGDTDA